MSGNSVKMEKSEESMGGGKSWGGGRDRDSSSDGVGDPGENTGLDPQLWHACAGGMVQLPPVGAKVIYFPQGHGEQAATPPEFPRILGPTGTIPCKVISVNYLADTETDEVYARIRLQPLPPEPAQSHSDSSFEADAPASPPQEKPASFAKTLTQSDANNGGGFSVPRYCAETIFPPLDYTIDPPVQTVLAKDVHGERWKFRHIYRGTPRRHLLTTGWSTFVNQKKLVAGDAIVFLRTASGELCVGVRRSMRGNGGSDSSTWSAGSSASHHRPNRWEVKGTESFSDFFGGDSGSSSVVSSGTIAATRGPGSSNSGPGIGMSGPSTSSSFARNRARVTAQSVLEAASLAANGQPFEVVYYPRASTAEFCVKAQAVKAALDQQWYAGMRFKMAFETEDSSRISWFMGTIAAVQPCDPLWSKSPWRVLQVNWDEPDLLQGVSRVSPWQVEVVSTLPMQLPPFSLPKKKLRAAQPSDMNMTGQGLMGMSMSAIPNVFGQINPWAHGLIMEEVSAGMQGARHDRVFGVALPEQFRSGKIQGRFFTADGFNHPDHSGRGCRLIEPHLNAYPLPGRESTLNNIMSPLGKPSQEDHGTAGGLIVPTAWTGASPNRSASNAPFVLFGQAINPDSNRSQHQHSGGSSSDGLTSLQHLKEESLGKRKECPSTIHNYKEESPVSRKESPSESSQTETAERAQKYMTVYLNGKPSDFKGSGPENAFKWESGWDKDRNIEKQGSSTTGESFSHCKVFRDSDEVGRTVDLFQFSSYDELYEKLAGMFSLEVKLLVNTMVYRDAGSFPKAVGNEPYRLFAKSAKRVIIQCDQNNSNMRA
ncbi:unnamed protein product [Calypogeia fissa]